MAKEKRGMDAVIAKTSKVGRPRKPVMLRKGAGKGLGKGPGIAIMIAVGKPKGEGQGPMRVKGEKTDDKAVKPGASRSKAQQIAALEEQIGSLKAELALLKGDEDAMEMDGEADDESEDDTEDDED